MFSRLSKTTIGRLLGAFAVGLLLVLPSLSFGTDTFVLSDVHLIGTGSDQLTVEDVIRGLNLKLGEPTTRPNLASACERFRKLRLFYSTECHYAIHGHSITLDINVEGVGMPVVFDNFVLDDPDRVVSAIKTGDTSV